MSHGKGWIGVDLDGTLAEYAGWQPDGGVGKPIPAMVARVKRWLAAGKEVRIMTARVCPNDLTGADGPVRQVPIIEEWCRVHLGVVLPVTAVKDYQMVELWDDRAVHVVPNTGIPGVHPNAYCCPACTGPAILACPSCNRPV